MNHVDYKLQSNIDQIAKCIKDTNIFLASEAKEEAEYILKYCPKELYKNIDEIVGNRDISDIEILAKINGKIKKISVNQVKKDFYNIPPDIIILKAICMHNNNEYGFEWLLEICQGY